MGGARSHQAAVSLPEVPPLRVRKFIKFLKLKLLEICPCLLLGPRGKWLLLLLIPGHQIQTCILGLVALALEVPGHALEKKGYF